MNTLTTQHTINYKGYKVLVKGFHKYRYLQNSKLTFQVWIMKSPTEGHGVTLTQKTTLEAALERLISNEKRSIMLKEKMSNLRAIYQACSTKELIAHPNFAYARFTKSGFGDYYNLYWKVDGDLSPTGVLLVGGCSATDWETFSKETKNSHNYLAPGEKY